jgi:hypothetical protein
MGELGCATHGNRGHSATSTLAQDTPPAQGKLTRLKREGANHAYVDFYQVAAIYAGLADKDEAFRLLEKGYEEHSASMPYLAVDPWWYGMRSDPRYADLLRRIGPPQ